MNLKLILLLFWSSIAYCQIPLNNIFQLNEFNDSYTIEDILEFDKQEKFNIPFKNETYKFIKDKEANWIKIEVTKQKEKHFLDIQNSLFEELNFYIKKDSSTVIVSENLALKNENRFPIIEILPKNTPCTVYIRTKDALSFRTEFTIGTYNEKEFYRKTQKDYFFIGSYSMGLSLLIIASTFFLLYKKEYTILFYTLHIVMMAVEFLISTGVFSQWVLLNSLVQKYNLDQITFTLAIIATIEFIRNYYPFTKKTAFCKHIYMVITIVGISILILAIADIFTGNQLNIEWYTQNYLDITAMISLLIHIILVVYKVIPKYLFIAFLFPVLGVFANNGDFKEQFDNPTITFFLFQSVYIGVIAQLTVIFFYVIKQSIDGELKANSLAQENNELKINFNEELSRNQEKHQNALMSDVHDSFGGYIEALKLTLINKKIKEDAVDEILDSFIKDYRLLLNSLYVPNIDAENFIGSIEEYCTKMDSLSTIEINFKTEKNNYSDIPQNIAKFVYKAASELTTNAIKYAKASKINLSLEIVNAKVSLKVLDNGIGFNKNEIKNAAFGISGINERANTFDGSLKIDSQINKGSSLILTLPIPETFN